MPVIRDIISGNGLPVTWIEVFHNPDLALHKVSVDTLGITNSTDLGAVVRVRLDDTVIFTRAATGNTTTTYEPDIIVNPGQRLYATADAPNRVDMYAVGRRDSAFNRFGMYLLPRMPETPKLIYEHPLNAGHRVILHSVVASRRSGTPPSNVDIYASTESGKITLLAGRVTTENYRWVQADMILKRGDSLWAMSDQAMQVDMAIVWEIEE